MNPRTWGKLTFGVLVIGGILAGLWAVYGSRSVGPAPDARPAVPRLADAVAHLRVRDGAGTRRAAIACDGERISAAGFWGADRAGACEALASTRAALLSGPGCQRIGRGQVGMVATGSFGARRFTHRAVLDGCPDLDGWLAVNALAAPVIEPDQELEGQDAGRSTGGGGSTSP